MHTNHNFYSSVKRQLWRVARRTKNLKKTLSHLPMYSQYLSYGLEDSQSAREFQLSQLKRLLTYANDNCLYYQRLFEEANVKPEEISTYDELARIPILRKKTLKHCTDLLLSRQFRKEKLDSRSTSGSSGTPLKLYHSPPEKMHWILMRQRVRGLNGIHYFRHRILNLICHDDRDRYHTLHYVLSRLGLGLECSIHILEPIEAQVELFKKLRPHAIWGHPSAVRKLGEELIRRNVLNQRPRFIFTVSEVYDDVTKSAIKECFGAKIIDYYGCMETGPIAWQMMEGGPYYVNNRNVLVEVVGDDDMPVTSSRVGRVVVTDLFSYAMPIIRYEIGDIV